MTIRFFENSLLFARVGFTPAVFMMLCQKIEGKTINKSTASRWATGHTEPKNPAYISLALELDDFLTDKACFILSDARDKLILPYYEDDESYYEATQELMPVSIYYALLHRIKLLAPDDLVIEYSNDDNMTDWDHYVALDVGFNLFF